MVYDISSVLLQWESFGVFRFILPFLLIFAIVFGILTSTNFITKDRKINVIISFVVALLGLQFGYVEIFGQLFSRMAVGLAVLLVVVILVAAFIPKEHLGGWAIAFYSLGAIIAIMVVYNSFEEFNWFGFGSYNFWNDYTGVIIAVLLTIAVIIAISVQGGKNGGKSGELTFKPIRD